MGAVKVLGVNMFTDIEEFKCRALYFFIHFELRLDGEWFDLFCFLTLGVFWGVGVFGNFFSAIVLLFFFIIFLFFALISPLSGFIV